MASVMVRHLRAHRHGAKCSTADRLNFVLCPDSRTIAGAKVDAPEPPIRSGDVARIQRRLDMSTAWTRSPNLKFAGKRPALDSDHDIRRIAEQYKGAEGVEELGNGEEGEATERERGLVSDQPEAAR